MVRKAKHQRNTPRRLSPIWQLIISGAILFHLVAVCAAPSMVATSGSPAIAPVYEALEPYYGATYLNHGYAFFAPNPPGENSLIRYRIEFDDGREPIERTFPDIDRHWPRLLYHRHFMLSEQFMNELREVQRFGNLREPLPGADEQQRAIWKFRHRQYQARRRSFEEHLLALHGGDRIRLVHVLHLVPTPDGFQKNRDLRHPARYLELDEFGNRVLPPDFPRDGEPIR